MIGNDGRVYIGKPARTVLGRIKQVSAAYCIQLTSRHCICVLPLILKRLSHNCCIRSHPGMGKRFIHLARADQNLTHEDDQAVFIIIIDISRRLIAEELIADFLSVSRTDRIIEYLIRTADTEFIDAGIKELVQGQRDLIVTFHQFYCLAEHLTIL